MSIVVIISNILIKLFFVFCGIGDDIKGLTHARQTLYPGPTFQP
jgi:hypothetical protein